MAVLKGENLKRHLEKFVKDFKIKHNRSPSIVEIRDGAKASTKSIRTYLTEGKDFTVMSRAESAKLGGDTTGAKTKGTIFNISADLQNKVDSTKLRGANLYIDSTKTGSKSLILQITDPKLKGNFFDGKNSLSLPATEENFKKFKKKLKTVENSKIYKKTIVPYKSSTQELAEKRGKYYQLKKGDPYHVQKKLAKEISEKGVTEIHHSRYKKFPQSTNVLMRVDPQINNLKSLKDAEKIRNTLIQEQTRILNPRSKLNFEDKKRNLEMINAKLTKLKNSLRGTDAAGLLDVRLITLDETGKAIIKDRGADFSKALGFETSTGNIDLTKIDRTTAKTIVNNTIENFIAKVKALPSGCRIIASKALGGKLDTCETIIKADPERAAVKLNNAITATKGPLKNLKDDSQKLIRLFRGESFPQRNIKGFKSSAKFFKTTIPEIKKDTLSGQWFTPTQDHAGSYLSRPGRMKYVDVTPAELESFQRYKDRVNKRPVKYSVARQMGKPERALHGVTDSFHHQIIPRYKLKQMEEAGRLKSKLDLNPFRKSYVSDAPLIPATRGVLEWNRDLGGFVDSANPSEIVGQNQIKAWAQDNPMPVQAGTSVKPGFLRKTGRALAHIGLPLPTAALDSYFIGRQIEEGRDAVDIAKDPFNWLGLATMDPLTRVTGMADKSGKLASVMRLGMSPGMIRGATRFLGLPGLALSTGLTAYDQYKKYQNKEGFIYDLFNKEEIDNQQV